MLVPSPSPTLNPGLSPRTLTLLDAMERAPETPEPPAGSLARRCGTVLLVWACVVAVALGVGFQFDPARAGRAPVSPWLSVPAGLAIAFAASWLAFGYIILIRESRDSCYLPGESKWLLSRRDRRYLGRLRSLDPELDRAVSQWLCRGRVFGVAQLNALAEAAASPAASTERAPAAAKPALRRAPTTFHFLLFLGGAGFLTFAMPAAGIPFRAWCPLYVGVFALVAMPWSAVLPLFGISPPHRRAARL